MKLGINLRARSLTSRIISHGAWANFVVTHFRNPSPLIKKTQAIRLPITWIPSRTGSGALSGAETFSKFDQSAMTLKNSATMHSRPATSNFNIRCFCFCDSKPSACGSIVSDLGAEAAFGGEIPPCRSWFSSELGFSSCPSSSKCVSKLGGSSFADLYSSESWSSARELFPTLSMSAKAASRRLRAFFSFNFCHFRLLLFVCCDCEAAANPPKSVENTRSILGVTPFQQTKNYKFVI